MDGFTQLVVLAAIMFISTFLLGSLPLTLSASLSPRTSHKLSIFSVGLLIGAALGIVIPEGVDTIYTSFDPPSPVNGTSLSPSSRDPSTQHAQHEGGHHSTIGLTLMSGFMLMFLIDQLAKFSTLHKSAKPVVSIRPLCGKLNSSQTEALLSESSQDNSAEESMGDLEESIPRNADSSQVLPLTAHEIRCNTRSHSFSTIIGLLTHSVADGIALGASSTHTAHLESNNPSKKITLNLIIFLALMVHKAPAAFGLVSVLLQEGLPKIFVRKALLAFSLAAPLGSLLTWTILAWIHRIRFGNNTDDSSSEQDGIQWWIGVTLLFSGGTFLFVATHALESTTSRPVDLCFPQILPPVDPPQSSACATSYDQQPTPDPQGISIHHGSKTRNESDSAGHVNIGPVLTSVLMTCGMFFPCILTLIVGGHH